MPTGALTDELLAHVDADLVAFRAPGQPKLALFRDPSLRADSSIDLRSTNIIQLSVFALQLMLDHRSDAIMRVVGNSPVDPMAEVELLLGQERICANLRSYAMRIAMLSLFIGLVTGLLLYLTLRWLIVRPVVRLTRAVHNVAEHPARAPVPTLAPAPAPAAAPAARAARALLAACAVPKSPKGLLEQHQKQAVFSAPNPRKRLEASPHSALQNYGFLESNHA